MKAVTIQEPTVIVVDPVDSTSPADSGAVFLDDTPVNKSGFLSASSHYSHPGRSRVRFYSDAVFLPDHSCGTSAPSLDACSLPSTSSHQQHHSLLRHDGVPSSLGSSRAFARLRLATSNGWLIEPQRSLASSYGIEPADDEERRYLEYYFDEDYEGLHIDDVERPPSFNASQYTLAGSELKANKRNRVEQMKLGKYLDTIQSRHQLTTAMIDKETKRVAFRLEQIHSGHSQAASRSLNQQRLAAQRRKDFYRRRRLFDKAIQLLQSSDLTLKELIRNSRVAGQTRGKSTAPPPPQLQPPQQQQPAVEQRQEQRRVPVHERLLSRRSSDSFGKLEQQLEQLLTAQACK